ncbi:MAG: phosphotransferase [Mycobacterium leprae]
MNGRPSAEVEQAAAAYGLDAASLEPLSSTYRAVAAYRAENALLKPYRYSERQLFYVTRALSHLAKCGCTVVPRLIETRRGEPYLRSGRRLWYALTWIPGCPVSFPTDLVEAARALARFHRAATGCFIPSSDKRSWPRRWRQIRTDLAEFAREAAAGATPFDILYSQAAPIFIGQAEACIAALNQPAYTHLESVRRQRLAFAHRDATAANLIRGEQGRVYLIDPDTLGPDLRLHDLTRMLLSGGVEDPEPLVEAIAAYDRIAPLEQAERLLLPAAYRLPREFWWAGVCRYRHGRPDFDPEELLRIAIAGAPGRDACAERIQVVLS